MNRKPAPRPLAAAPRRPPSVHPTQRRRSSAVYPVYAQPQEGGAEHGERTEMSFERRAELYERIATLRSETFDLLGRLRGPAYGDASEELRMLSAHLQGVANQLGAVEALVAVAPEAA